MLDRCGKFLSRNPAMETFLHMSLGDEQLERINYERMVDLLQKSSPKGFDWTSETFEQQDDHMSMRITGQLAGIRWVFRNWRLTSNQIYAMTDDDVDKYFASATRRYKQQRSLGMLEMTDAGYWGIYDAEKSQRAMKLFRLAVKTWPNQASRRPA